MEGVYLDRKKAKMAARNANKRAEKQNAIGRITEQDVLTLFEFFGFRCIYCGGNGRDTSGYVIGLDHIVSMADGGRNELHNIVCSCRPCNTSKNRHNVYKWMRRERRDVDYFVELLKLWHEFLEAYKPD